MNAAPVTSGPDHLSPGDAGPAQCPYLVVRDADSVRDILHRPEDFSPANALVAATPLSGAALRVLQQARFALPPVLASNDTDTHAGIRKVVGAYFTPATVAAVEPRIRELARAAAADAAGQLACNGRVDLVRTVAANLPAVVMHELLGLPVRDLPRLKRWSLESMELFWGWPDDARQLELARSAADYYVWLRRLVTDSVDAPGRNLFKSLAVHGLSTPEICSLGYFLLIAGQETTTQLISTALFRLLEGSAPVDWKDAASEEGSRAVVRHVLATESSVPTWRRVAAHDTRLGAELIPAGAEILLQLTGTCEMPDGEQPDQPGTAADPLRKSPTAYALAFGSGIHRCLGAKLAELEAAVVVRETAAALPGLQLADRDPDWIRLLSFQAPKTVTVTGGPGSLRTAL